MTPALAARTPRHALWRDAAVHACATGIGVLVAAVALSQGVSTGPWFVAKAVAGYCLWIALFVPLLGSSHPFGRLGPANRITLARAGLTAVMAAFLGEPVTAAAASIIIGAGVLALVLDGVDGRLARSSGMASPFGARFDMETDALLILLFAVLAWQLDKAGAWVLLSGLLRYLFIAAGVVLPWMRAPLPYSRRRQTVCVLQIIAMLAVLLPFVASPASDLLSAAALAMLAGSFLVDVVWLWRHRATESTPASAAKGETP